MHSGSNVAFVTFPRRCQARIITAVVLSAAVTGCVGDARELVSRTSRGSSAPSAAALPTSTRSTTTAGERIGVVKSGPTVRLRETDEFGLVVRAERSKGVVRVTVDRVDSLTGQEGEQAAAARGVDYANDHIEINDSPQTLDYVLAGDPAIWQANPSDAGSPQPMTVAAWLTYLGTDQGRRAMFHFDVEGGRVVGIEEQYYP